MEQVEPDTCHIQAYEKRRAAEKDRLEEHMEAYLKVRERRGQIAKWITYAVAVGFTLFGSVAILYIVEPSFVFSSCDEAYYSQSSISHTRVWLIAILLAMLIITTNVLLVLRVL